MPAQEFIELPYGLGRDNRAVAALRPSHRRFRPLSLRELAMRQPLHREELPTVQSQRSAIRDRSIATKPAYPTPEHTESVSERASFVTQPLSAQPELVANASKLDKEHASNSRLTTMRALKSSGRLRHLKDPMPGLSRDCSQSEPQCRSQVTTFPVSSTTNAISVPPGVADGSSQNLSLADITDFKARSKVALLMAVAPGLPVKDLHDLLLDMNGRFEKARESLVRYVSQAPSCRTPAIVGAEPVKPGPTVSEPIEANAIAFNERHTNAHDVLVTGDGEEIMIKVDLEDPEIWMDNNVPSSPAPTIRLSGLARPRISKTNIHRRPRPKTTSRTAHPPHRITTKTSSTVCASISRPESKVDMHVPKLVQPLARVEKNLPQARHRRTRSNSIDNIFVIYSSGTDSDSQGSYQESTAEMDTDDEDATDVVD